MSTAGYEPEPVSAQRFRTHSILAVLACTLIIALSGCAQLGSPAADAAPAPTATVLRVIDGDTLDVRDDNRGRLRVRALGIDRLVTEALRRAGAPDYDAAFDACGVCCSSTSSLHPADGACLFRTRTPIAPRSIAPPTAHIDRW